MSNAATTLSDADSDDDIFLSQVLAPIFDPCDSECHISVAGERSTFESGSLALDAVADVAPTERPAISPVAGPQHKLAAQRLLAVPFRPRKSEKVRLAPSFTLIGLGERRSIDWYVLASDEDGEAGISVRKSFFDGGYVNREGRAVGRMLGTGRVRWGSGFEDSDRDLAFVDDMPSIGLFNRQWHANFAYGSLRRYSVAEIMEALR